MILSRYTVFGNLRWDTGGVKEYEESRKACYNETDVLLICFSIAEPDTLENVMSYWVEEANMDVLKKVPVSESLLLYKNITKCFIAISVSCFKMRIVHQIQVAMNICKTFYFLLNNIYKVYRNTLRGIAHAP